MLRQSVAGNLTCRGIIFCILRTAISLILNFAPTLHWSVAARIDNILSSCKLRRGESDEKCTLPPILVGSGFVVKRLVASTNYKLWYNTWLSQKKVVWSSCGSVLHAEDFLVARCHDYPTFSLLQESSKIEILEPSPPFGHCYFCCPPLHHRRRQSICYCFTNYLLLLYWLLFQQ
jgi:hypothetical protein